jgi:ribosomal protein S18 acetylase RimI-like enzyme
LTIFDLQYESLILHGKRLACDVAAVPWDTETFGFGVATLRLSCGDCLQDNESFTLKEALAAYAERTNTQLVITSIPSDHKADSLAFQSAGFRAIDMALSVSYESLNGVFGQHPVEISLTPMTPEQADSLIELAGGSFQYGRYHRDTSISDVLADERYKDWMRRSLNPNNPQIVLAAMWQGHICGFSVVENTGTEGYLHLHAIDSRWQGKRLGAQMICESLRYLDGMGVETVRTKISAANLRALNMHARLKGRFTNAEQLLHWHWEEQ